ncbi:protein of unknown function DUF917 [Desulforamulus reducens MI-1]|uniref:DUF917 domain-containing protein n=1 Tax=Desulforamulus reducens (strain ATCC BAA-1160 / DSM 100696 / MI-1) TaxID=349161 RepID=A4J4R8_DESRM|nr:DUF917 domain-containing protein [Desulforamulus reducens]ABO50071.1 protein of unknown function DUF917 [Desulforamulus reducens MI-1]
MAEILIVQDILPLSLGSILLGSGGGGNAFILSTTLENYLGKHKSQVEVIPYHQLPDNYTVASIGLLGSPELMEENLPDGSEGERAIELLEKNINRKIDALFALEGAGINILYPVLVAARTGIPLVDGDGMGRAFPELQMTTFHIYGQPSTPSALTNSEGKENLLFYKDHFLHYYNIRKTLVEYGGVGYFAGLAMNGQEMKEAIIPGTLSFALEMGQALKNNHYQEAFWRLQYITKNSIYGQAIELFIGTVVEFGNIATLKLKSIILKGINQYQDDTFQVLVENENAFAYHNEKMVAMVPDIISFLEYPSGQPINNNEIYTGRQIAVIGIPCPNQLRTREALAVIGPSTFGYKTQYEPLEQLHPNYYFNNGV